jgi:hypothetical protein
MKSGSAVMGGILDYAYGLEVANYIQFTSLRRNFICQEFVQCTSGNFVVTEVFPFPDHESA